MRPLSARAQVRLVRLCYLLPVLNGAILLALACIPHLFYQSGPDALDTLSLMQLLQNTYSNCIGFLQGSADGSVAAFYFSVVMMIFWALCWLTMVLYALFALASAVLCALIVWTPGTASQPWMNTAKRCYRMLVPNRVCYGIWCALPLLPSFFPYILQGFYRSILGEQATLHYFGLPDPVYVILLAGLAAALFVLTLPAQKEYRMDLFRLYKPGR